MPWFKMCKRGAIMARHFSFIWETSYTTLAKPSINTTNSTNPTASTTAPFSPFPATMTVWRTARHRALHRSPRWRLSSRISAQLLPALRRMHGV